MVSTNMIKLTLLHVLMELIQVVEVNMKVEEPGPDNPHNNAFYAEETLLRTELQAQRDCNALSHRHWIVSFIQRSGCFCFRCSFLSLINAVVQMCTHAYYCLCCRDAYL